MLSSLLLSLSAVAYGFPRLQEHSSPQCDGVISQEERLRVLDLHNSARSRLASGDFQEGRGRFMPPAANMLQLDWDCDLERSAQIWAEECRFQHSNISGVGENLYMVVANKPMKREGLIVNATETWLDEFQKYGWDSIRLTKEVFYTGVGHATQMVWASSRRLGCSSSSCRGGKDIIVVCHYKSGGNVLGENVYEFGEACSSCPRGTICNSETLLCT